MLERLQQVSATEVQAVCTQGINLFRVLAVYLKPVMPRLAAGAEKFFGLPSQNWADAATPLLDTAINAYEPLATRVDPAAVKALLAASAESLKPVSAPEAAATTVPVVTAKSAAKLGRHCEIREPTGKLTWRYASPSTSACCRRRAMNIST